jgi:hypothetical protein
VCLSAQIWFLSVAYRLPIKTSPGELEMKETLHIFSGTPKNARWEDSAEGLSDARERMEQLAGTKPGQYFLVSIGAGSILAQTETFSQPQRISRGNGQTSAAQLFFNDSCGGMTRDPG